MVRSFSFSLVLILGLACVSKAYASEPEQGGFDFWTPHYILDYGLGTGGLLLELFYRGEPRDKALIGPSFDPEEPSRILSAEWSDLLGSPFLPEHEWTMPNSWLEIAAYGQLVLVPGHEILARWSRGQKLSPHRLHHSMTAVFQATAVNAGLSRVVKSFTGRLRPDFQERVVLAYCSLPDHQGVDCSGVDPDRLFEDPKEALSELREGRYSFMSGHAMNAMLVSTNLALQTGGLWVWGEEATASSRFMGISAIAVLYTLGLYSGISRTSLMDGVHHTSDVVAGSFAGMAIGNLFYWINFDTKGRPRSGHWLNRRHGSAKKNAESSGIRVALIGTNLVLSSSW